ncbi:nitroreductase family protein [Bacteroidota bacterium]
MNFNELIKKNRSYRRFHQDQFIDNNTLKELVELARLSPSAKNIQPLKFFLSNSPDSNEKIFSCLKWAGYISDWSGPKEGEKPSAYIIILGDHNILNSIKWDDGIAAHSILLGAVEKGLGGCMIASINRERLKELLKFPENMEPLIITAIGKPKEKVAIDPVKVGDIKYWRDENQVHHVPKRSLDELIVNLSE